MCHPAMNVSRGLRWVCVPKRLQNENPQYSRTRAQECQKHGFFTKVPQYRVLGPLGLGSFGGRTVASQLPRRAEARVVEL